MTQVQVSDQSYGCASSRQNVFVIPEGGMKHTMAELERRKFTAEEGVSWITPQIYMLTRRTT